MENQVSERLLFALSIINILSQHSQPLSVHRIQAKLEEKGFTYSIRTVQRTLKSLDESALFDLEKNVKGNRYLWTIHNTAYQGLKFEPHEALAWVMTEKYLDKLLPQVVFENLRLQFNHARSYLNSASEQFQQWENKVRAIAPGKRLLPAVIADDKWTPISLALLEFKVINVEYSNRNKDGCSQYRLHPLGLVLKGNSIYLLAMINDYEDVKQFALNRFEKVEILDDCDARTKADFDIDKYIDQGNFEIPLDEQAIQLKAIIDDEVAFHLRETPLSDGQSIYEDEGILILEAQTIYSRQMIWWIMGFGDKITILEPVELRDYIQKSLTKALLHYNNTDKSQGIKDANSDKS